MQSNEAAALAAMKLDLNDFEPIMVTESKRKSTYQPLFDFIPQMEVGQIYAVTGSINGKEIELGWNKERTFKHNCTNILSCVGKNEKLNGYKIMFVEITKKGTAEKIVGVKLLKKPAETAPIPANLVKNDEVKDPTTEQDAAEIPNEAKED